MYRTVEEQRRRWLLYAALSYGACAWTAALLALLHLPYAKLAIAAVFAAIWLSVTVSLNRPLGPHRIRLLLLLVLLGPLGVIPLSRRTRGWQPLLAVRPDSRRDR